MGVAEEDKEPAAKRAKTTCEPQGSESDTEELCMDENSTFLERMRSLNQVVEENVQGLCEKHIKDKDLDRMNILMKHYDDIKKRCQDGKILRTVATKTASSLVEFFSGYPSLTDEVDHLKKWLHGSAIHDVKKKLQFLLKGWDNAWKEQKTIWFEKEDWCALTNLQAKKAKLQTWISQEQMLPVENVLSDLQELKSFQCCQYWRKVEALFISQCKNLKRNSDEQTTEEIMDAENQRCQSLNTKEDLIEETVEEVKEAEPPKCHRLKEDSVEKTVEETSEDLMEEEETQKENEVEDDDK